MAKYECDKCGACCKGHLLVEAYELDVLRETKLATADIGKWTREMTLQTLMEELDQEGTCLVIVGGKHACSFLGKDGMCEIYATRPNVCVAMDAGGDQCQTARQAEGTHPLEPIVE